MSIFGDNKPWDFHRDRAALGFQGFQGFHGSQAEERRTFPSFGSEDGGSTGSITGGNPWLMINLGELIWIDDQLGENSWWSVMVNDENTGEQIIILMNGW